MEPPGGLLVSQGVGRRGSLQIEGPKVPRYDADDGDSDPGADTREDLSLDEDRNRGGDHSGYEIGEHEDVRCADPWDGPAVHGAFVPMISADAVRRVGGQQ